MKKIRKVTKNKVKRNYKMKKLTFMDRVARGWKKLFTSCSK